MIEKKAVPRLCGSEREIVIDGQSTFPKILKIIMPHRTEEYRLIKTKLGKFQLTK